MSLGAAGQRTCFRPARASNEVIEAVKNASEPSTDSLKPASVGDSPEIEVRSKRPADTAPPAAPPEFVGNQFAKTVKPKSIKAATAIMRILRGGLPVRVDLNDLSDVDALRIIDFVAGLVAMSGGTIVPRKGRAHAIIPGPYVARRRTPPKSSVAPADGAG